MDLKFTKEIAEVRQAVLMKKEVSRHYSLAYSKT
jgi:hypothetical protein